MLRDDKPFQHCRSKHHPQGFGDNHIPAEGAVKPLLHLLPSKHGVSAKLTLLYIPALKRRGFTEILMKKNPDWLTEAIDAHAYWTTTVKAHSYTTTARGTSRGPKLCIPETETLDGAYLRGAILNGVDLSNQSLVGADLVGAKLGEANLSGANLSGANLCATSLFEANLRNANLRDADLRNADFWNANLRDSNLENANLENANLRIATVRGATLVGANLSHVDLTGADLRQSDLKGANLRGAKIRDVVGDNVYLMSVQLPEYDINYTHDRLQIGCKNFPLLDWWGFDDRFIASLDTGALDWWNTYKPILMGLIKANPATKD